MAESWILQKLILEVGEADGIGGVIVRYIHGSLLDQPCVSTQGYQWRKVIHGGRCGAEARD
jgi:hypothetical protein